MQDLIPAIAQNLHDNPDQALPECQRLVSFLFSQMTAMFLMQGNVDSALHWTKHLTELIPQQPLPKADLAYLLGLKGQFDEAVKYSKEAAESEQPIFEIYQIHGDVLYGARQYQEAIQAYRKALALQPDHVAVHFHLSDCLIRTGQYREGLQEHEWRLKFFPKYIAFRKRYEKPDWSGEPNKRVLVVNEQGLGDAIQYCRYLPKLAQQCQVIVEVQDELVNLFEQLPNIKLVGRSHDFKDRRPLPEHDYITYFTSLPYWFDPDLNNIPCRSQYLKAPTKPLTLKHYDFKVGICWAGNYLHALDHIRSCHLKEFAPLKDIPGVGLFSLQKGQMLRNWSGDLTAGGFNITNTSEYLGDMSTTANLINHLDLVITVDTSIAHLAGALGKPVWVLIAKDLHDRRWGEAGEQTVWYDSMRLFRQKTIGNWTEVIQEVKTALERIL